ncbi:MAG: ubiA prenyltransferase family protein [Thermoleophilia bacterium]|nr:ubiA prenyltransferase family protein [Thermoleophilia bacterium]
MAEASVIDTATSTEVASEDALVARGAGAPRRALAFLLERFPPAPQLILMAVLFVAATLMSGILLDEGLTGHLGDVQVLPAICGFVGSLLFIVRLRVYDDVKDADTDRVENPTRPIPRGLVSIRELDVTGLIILVVEGALIASVGRTTFILWAIAAAWSVLMRMEFFAPEWLDRHMATFAISHMVVMGLIYGALLAIGVDARGGSASAGDLLASPLVLGAMLAATSIGIGFEWGRKFERYFEQHGEHAWSAWLLWPSLGAIGFTLLARDSYPTWATMVLGVVAMATIVSHAFIMGQRSRPVAPAKAGAVPTGNLRGLVEALPGAAGLLVYLVLAAAGVVELVR